VKRKINHWNLVPLFVFFATSINDILNHVIVLPLKNVYISNSLFYLLCLSNTEWGGSHHTT